MNKEIRHHVLKNDAFLSDFTEVRGTIGQMAEKQKMPKRFIVKPSVGTPSVWVVDTQTNKSTLVSLFAYKEVKKVLNDLFGE